MSEDKKVTSINPKKRAEAIECSLPDIPGMTLSEDFGDIETLMNSRDWLEAALENAGAKLIDGGMGMGQADVGIEIEGCEFSISMRPRLNETTQEGG